MNLNPFRAEFYEQATLSSQKHSEEKIWALEGCFLRGAQCLRAALWNCICACGTKRKVIGTTLRNGESLSCGCFHRESVSKSWNPRAHPFIGKVRHGASKKGKRWPEYVAYVGAKGRCNNSKDESFENYGGRGIEFRYENFEQFIADVGRRPRSGYTLERKNNNGHYEPGNCKWATMSEQLKNRRKGLRKRLQQFSDAEFKAECARRGWNVLQLGER